MKQANPVIQQAHPLAHAQLGRTQPPLALETRGELDPNVEAPKATTEGKFAPLACCCKNIVFCPPLIKERKYWIRDHAGAEEAVKTLLGLFAKPSLRVEEWMRNRLEYFTPNMRSDDLAYRLFPSVVAPPNMILFDVMAGDLEGPGSCTYCSNFGDFDNWWSIVSRRP